MTRTPKATGVPRLAALDGMRFVAAFMVVLFHYTAIGTSWGQKPQTIFPGLHAVTTYGALGVEFFFLISGFVICMSSWGRGIGDFAVSRLTRLYPAYWVSVLLTTAVLFLWPVWDRPHPSMAAMLTNLTMLQSALHQPNVDPVYWTLWFELEFYILFSIFVIRRGVTYERVLRFCLGWSALSAISWSVEGKIGLNIDGVIDAQYSCYFVAGITVYLMYRFRPTPLLWGLLGYSYLVGLWVAGRHVSGNDVFVDWSSKWWPSTLLVTLFFVILLACSIGPLAKLRWRWLTTAGALTYPLYLVHESLGHVIAAHLHNSVPTWPLMLLCLAVVLTTAYLIHRLVEAPLAPRLRRWLRRGLDDIHALDRRDRADQRTSPESGLGGAGGVSPADGDDARGAREQPWERLDRSRMTAAGEPGEDLTTPQMQPNGHPTGRSDDSGVLRPRGGVRA